MYTTEFLGYSQLVYFYIVGSSWHFLLIFGQRKLCIACWQLVTIPVLKMARNDAGDARISQFTSAQTFIVVTTE